MCALYAAGRTSGLSIDIGDSVTSVIPFFEGYACVYNDVPPFDKTYCYYGGADVTDYLADLMQEKGD